MRKITVSLLDQARIQEQIQGIKVKRGLTQEMENLQNALDQAQIVEPHLIPSNVVTLNTIVTVKFLTTGKDFTFRLVYPEDANARLERVSIFSPIGVALLGYRKGDTILWNAPGGKMKIQVKDITYQPEAEGAFHL